MSFSFVSPFFLFFFWFKGNTLLSNKQALPPLTLLKPLQTLSKLRAIMRVVEGFRVVFVGKDSCLQCN
jgi:hypothetical protein